jgi:HSP20 family protein
MSNLLARFEPDMRLLRGLRSGMDQFFDEFFQGAPFLPGTFASHSTPALNLWEDEKNLYAECEIPGVRLEDLDISVVGRELRLKGSWNEQSAENVTVHRRERVSGSFERTVELGVEIDAEKVTAELADGVLSITLPKAERALPRKVEVKALEG